MNMLLLVGAMEPDTVVEVGKEVSQKALVSGHETWERITAQVGSYIPHAAAALAVLIIGWIVALAIAAVVRGALRKLGSTGDSPSRWPTTVRPNPCRSVTASARGCST
jgi:hypothetical protein